MTAHGYPEFAKRAGEFITNGSVPCPDCGEMLPAGDEETRRAHYAQCQTARQIVIDDEFRDLLLPQTVEENRELEASLQAEGCRDALKVWKETNTLLDGHHRYALCQQHGIHFRVEYLSFETREDALLWMIHFQLARRNITDCVRIQLVLKMKNVYADKAKAQQGTRTDLLLNSTKGVEPINTRAELAELANTSQDKVRKVEVIERDALPEIKAKARSGELSVHGAFELTKALKKAPDAVKSVALRLADDNPEKVEILHRLYKTRHLEGSNATFDEIAATGGFHYGDELRQHMDFSGGRIQDIQKALKTLEKHHARAAADADIQRRLDASQTPAPEGRYRCIVIDPPWDMHKIERDLFPQQGYYLDYPTLTLEQIQALPVADLAHEDGCHLYLWTTQKYLPDALALLAAWDFRYQCLMTWIKPSGFTPYSWMYNTEHVIFARRGKLPLLQNGLKLSIEAPNTGHSIKPDAFFERVLQASPEPRLEMFARKQREGFLVWGDEVHA